MNVNIPAVDGIQPYTAPESILLFVLSPESQVGAVLPQTPLATRHLANADGIRALLVHTGSDEGGQAGTLKLCEAAAAQTGCQADQVLPFAAGRKATAPDEAAVCTALSQAKPADWASAAAALAIGSATPKTAARQAQIGNYHTVRASGIANSGSAAASAPLVFIATDASIAQPVLQQLAEDIAAETLPAAGTNGGFAIIATARSGQNEIDNIADPRHAQIRALLGDIARELAGRP